LIQGFRELPEHEIHVLLPMRRDPQPSRGDGNVTFHDVATPMWGMMKSLYLGAALHVRRKLLEIRPEVVHGQGTERECGICAVLSGFPNVITIHGNMRLIAKMNRAAPFSYPWISARLEEFTIPRADGIVCISRYTQDAVKNCARRTWLAPNAVEQGFFEIKRATPSRRLILCIGDIMPRKNQNAFIRALDPLAQHAPFEVVFMGKALPSDPYAIEFQEIVKRRPWCRYLGVAGREELRNWLVNAEMLVLPSLEENCPMVILEAMAAGVPVLASNVGGIPDLIKSNENGALFDPTNADSMRQAVERALEDSANAEAMAEAAKNKMVNEYRAAVIASRHIEIYRDLLSS
jgi:glycosyltransferase involved in cell wall biosynthesis